MRESLHEDQDQGGGAGPIDLRPPRASRIGRVGLPLLATLAALAAVGVILFGLPNPNGSAAAAPSAVTTAGGCQSTRCSATEVSAA